MTPDRTSLWAHVARESLFGNRGLTKAVMLLLPWALIRTLGEGRPVPGGDATGFFRILFVNVCWTLVCILANDLVDRAEDRAAGKRRWIARLSLPLAGSVVLALLGGGLAILAISRARAGAWLAFIAASALGLLYSIPPIRMKRRGAWGPLFYSLAGMAGYVVLPWAWMGASPIVLVALAPAVFLDKWVNIHFHQVIDHDCDAAHGTRTYAVLAGVGRADRTLHAVAAFATVWFAGTIIFLSLALEPGWRAIIPAAAVLVVLGSAYYSASSKRKGRRETPLVQKLSFIYLGTSYALFRAIPVILMVRLAIQDPALAAAAAAAILLVGAESFFVYSYRYE